MGRKRKRAFEYIDRWRSLKVAAAGIGYVGLYQTTPFSPPDEGGSASCRDESWTLNGRESPSHALLRLPSLEYGKRTFMAASDKAESTTGADQVIIATISDGTLKRPHFMPGVGMHLSVRNSSPFGTSCSIELAPNYPQLRAKTRRTEIRPGSEHG